MDWTSLDDFTRAYIECALWSSTDDDGNPLDDDRDAAELTCCSVGWCVRKILKEHGKTCGTHELARDYYARRHARNPYTAEEFTRALAEEYLSILGEECEYLLSNESVDESIRANGYTFSEKGKRLD